MFWRGEGTRMVQFGAQGNAELGQHVHVSRFARTRLTLVSPEQAYKNVV